LATSAPAAQKWRFTLQKAPFRAIFGLSFVDFPRVFHGRFFDLPKKGAKWRQLSPERAALDRFPVSKWRLAILTGA